jgi:L-asparagine transporter-like permease
VLIVLVVLLNVFAVRIYGETEFIFASTKIIAIVALLILSVCIDLGGTLKHDRLGFMYWKHPGGGFVYQHLLNNKASLIKYSYERTSTATCATGRFLGFFACLVTAAFTFDDIETVAVAASETENPRSAISLYSLHNNILTKPRENIARQSAAPSDVLLYFTSSEHWRLVLWSRTLAQIYLVLKRPVHLELLDLHGL